MKTSIVALSLCFMTSLVHAQVLIDQNFEDESVFDAAIEAPVGAGVGDSTTTAGFWKNFVDPSKPTPKAYPGNSSFTAGDQRLALTRGSWGDGYLKGYRTDASASDVFSCEFSIMNNTDYNGAELGLINAAQEGRSQVAVILVTGTATNGILKARDDDGGGTWKTISSAVPTTNTWIGIKMAGSVTNGTYQVSVDWNDGGGWRLVSTVYDFDNTVLDSVAGFYSNSSWTDGDSYFLDDIKLEAISPKGTVIVVQ